MLWASAFAAVAACAALVPSTDSLVTYRELSTSPVSFFLNGHLAVDALLVLAGITSTRSLLREVRVRAQAGQCWTDVVGLGGASATAGASAHHLHCFVNGTRRLLRRGTARAVAQG